MSLHTGGLHTSRFERPICRERSGSIRDAAFSRMREADGAVLLNANGTVLDYWAPSGDSPKDRFDPFRVGLDHIALAVDNAESCTSSTAIAAAGGGVRNNGVGTTPLRAPGTSLLRPDGIAWELYAMPAIR